MAFSNKIKRNQPSIKVGDTFDNNHSDDQVTVTMYGGYNNVTVEFSDGRQGFGSVLALRTGTIKPEGK